MFLKKRTEDTMKNNLDKLKEAIQDSEAILIGAGSGLSTSAGFTYSGERFEKYFYDFISKYGFRDAYSGGFYPFETLEEYWAYWSRYIYINRYMNPTKSVYKDLLNLVKNKDYFVITTNVDHCFQNAGFAKDRLFYTQGDYGLFQCSQPCHFSTYDNKDIVVQMVESQGFEIGENGELMIPETTVLKMNIPSSLVPHCPKCGRPMEMNLRADNTFVEDDGWHKAKEKYALFVERHEGLKMLFLELGVGYNTPIIIKYPFWQATLKSKTATYACINKGDVCVPEEIKKKSICIDGDIGKVLKAIQ